jgi:hypothetical protein
MKCNVVPGSFKNCYTTVLLAALIIYIAYHFQQTQIKSTTIFIITTILLHLILTYDPTFLCNVFKENCLRNVALFRSFTATMSLITIYLAWNRFFNHHYICLGMTLLLYLFFLYRNYKRYVNYHKKEEVEKVLQDENNLLRCQLFRILLISVLFFFDVYLILSYNKKHPQSLYEMIGFITFFIICPILTGCALYGTVKYDITEIQIT